MGIYYYLVGIIVGVIVGMEIKQLSDVKLSKGDYITIGIVSIGIILLIIGTTMEWQTKYF